MKGKPVHDCRHPMLADAVVDIAARCPGAIGAVFGVSVLTEPVRSAEPPINEARGSERLESVASAFRVAVFEERAATRDLCASASRQPSGDRRAR